MNLLYTGDFTDELTDKLIELNNYQFNQSNELNKTQRKVGFLIAECFQNIVRHADLTAADSYFHTQNKKGVFSIVSGNIVKDEMITTLKSQLEQLNELTSEELKEIYRKTLVDGTISERGGAGLGLIEMARKTKNKLSFNFSKIDETKSLFYFQLQLKTPEFVESKLKSNLDNSIALRKKMNADEVFLIYKGIISTKIAHPVLEMVENSVHSSSQKAIVMSLMKLLQSSTTQDASPEKRLESMLVVGKDDTKHKIGSMNYIYNIDVPNIEKAFQTYTSPNQELIDADNNKDLGLSILEILRNNSEIDYNIEKVDKDRSILTLQITTRI